MTTKIWIIKITSQMSFLIVPKIRMITLLERVTHSLLQLQQKKTLIISKCIYMIIRLLICMYIMKSYWAQCLFVLNGLANGKGRRPIILLQVHSYQKSKSGTLTVKTANQLQFLDRLKKVRRIKLMQLISIIQMIQEPILKQLCVCLLIQYKKNIQLQAPKTVP